MTFPMISTENASASGAATGTSLGGTPTILQIPVIPGPSGGPVSAVSTVTTGTTGASSSPTIQFVVVPAGTGQAQAVLSLLTGGGSHPASLQNVVASTEQQATTTTNQAHSGPNSMSFEFNKTPPGTVGGGPSDVSLPGCAGDNGVKRKISAEDIKPGWLLSSS